MRTIIEQEIFREIPVKENGRIRKMPIKQAIVRQIFAKSAQGDDKAIRNFMHLNRLYPTDDCPPTHGKHRKGLWIFHGEEEFEALENLVRKSKSFLDRPR